MSSTFKKELILEGLDCVNCANKIEGKVKVLEGVTDASLNFVTKTLVIETEEKDKLKKAVEDSKVIINKLEPEVKVKEKLVINNPSLDHKKIVEKASSEDVVLTLQGLNCANCAAKIEKQVSDLDQVKEATLDFVSKRLIIKIQKDMDKQEITDKAKAIVNRLEPEVRVYSESFRNKGEDNKEHHHREMDNEEKEEILRLVVGAAFFAVPLIFNLSPSINLILYLVSYILVGGEVVLRAVKNILRGEIFDENFLMTIATIGAFAIKEYPEAVAVMLFYQVGELFQDMAVNRSRKSISELMDIRPDFATVKRNGYFVKADPEEVAVGDIIMIKPGEKIPLDGVVIEGKTMVDTSALTGESVPRNINIGNEVLGGFINKNGVIQVEVKKEFGESTVSKILNLVENAGAKKAPTEKFITKFARYYTPIVVFSAVALAIIPPIFINGARFSECVYRALVFLVVSCPCALVISIPLGFFGGIGAASKKGILVKGGNYLEALNNVETVVFDKTGTLTKGVFKVTEINPEQWLGKEGLLKYAAYAESHSNHPIAQSIMKAYDKEIDKNIIDSYEEISGQGISVKVEGKKVLAGNKKLMDKYHIKVKEQNNFGTVVHLAVDNIYAGFIVISDEIKEDSKEAIKALKLVGVKNTVMLTGDSKAVADKVAAEIGVDHAYSELLPQDKVEKLEELDKEKSPKGKLIFVGDGINDAPVLARADIGIAMGGIGSDAAIEAADVVIMTDEPSKIVSAISIARKTQVIVWQNIVFALAIKIVILILGALGIANMWEAVFGDVGVALLAVLNSMRVLKLQK